MKFWITILFLAIGVAGHAQADQYLARIPKYNEASVFEDVRYKGMDWQHFYKLEEANDLVDPMNYDFDLLNAAMFFAVNKYRSVKGIKQLAFEPRLRDAASIHSDQMVKRKFFDHINRADAKVSYPNVRIELCGYQGERLSENLARSYVNMERPMTYTQIADMVVQQLSKSSEHNTHMIDPKMDKLGCAALFENSPSEGVFYFRLTQDYGQDWR
jgi:uncharacterized protein YkwD